MRQSIPDFKFGFEPTGDPMKYVQRAVSVDDQTGQLLIRPTQPFIQVVCMSCSLVTILHTGFYINCRLANIRVHDKTERSNREAKNSVTIDNITFTRAVSIFAEWAIACMLTAGWAWLAARQLRPHCNACIILIEDRPCSCEIGFSYIEFACQRCSDTMRDFLRQTCIDFTVRPSWTGSIYSRIVPLCSIGHSGVSVLAQVLASILCQK